MESLRFSTLDMGHSAPGGLFETFEIPNDYQSKLGYEEKKLNYNGNDTELFEDILDGYSTTTGWMELTSDSMSSFLELQEISEIKTDLSPPPPPQRASVIKSPIKKKTKPVANLANIMIDCGIEEVGMYDTNMNPYDHVQSPGERSEVSEMEQNQELIDDLEDFFIQTEGSQTCINETPDAVVLPNPTTEIPSHNKVNDETILKALSTGNVLNSQELLSEEDLKDAYKTTMTTEDGQNVIIIIATSTPKQCPSPSSSPIHMTCLSPSNTSDYETSYETDPEWVPSPMNNEEQNYYPSQTSDNKMGRKKYARAKPPTAPTGPYPTEKKERKKAQNRTAAFRYREKKKGEQDDIDQELEDLSKKNVILREKMNEMETEFKYLKKLMTEAGLGKYAAAVSF